MGNTKLKWTEWRRTGRKKKSPSRSKGNSPRAVRHFTQASSQSESEAGPSSATIEAEPKRTLFGKINDRLNSFAVHRKEKNNTHKENRERAKDEQKKAREQKKIVRKVKKMNKKEEKARQEEMKMRVDENKAKLDYIRKYALKGIQYNDSTSPEPKERGCSSQLHNVFEDAPTRSVSTVTVGKKNKPTTTTITEVIDEQMLKKGGDLINFEDAPTRSDSTVTVRKKNKPTTTTITEAIDEQMLKKGQKNLRDQNDHEEDDIEDQYVVLDMIYASIYPIQEEGNYNEYDIYDEKEYESLDAIYRSTFSRSSTPTPSSTQSKGDAVEAGEAVATVSANKTSRSAWKCVKSFFSNLFRK